MRIARMLVVCGVLAAGCSDDDPVGATGRVEGLIADDPSKTTAGPAALVGAAAAAYSGTITTNANLEISADGVTWVTLGSPNGITIKLQDDESSTIHGEVDAPAGTYRHVRVTLREGRTTILAGSVVGGITIGANVVVMLGGTDGNVVLQKEVSPFEVRSNATSKIFLELNSEAWLTSANVQDQMVDDVEVSQALAVRVALDS